MKDLGTVLKDFQDKFPKINDQNIADALELIKKDEDVREFWSAHRQELKTDAFSVSMMDLYEFVTQKEKANQSKDGLYPGYLPTLVVVKGYPRVAYQASQETIEQARRQERLNTLAVPKSVWNADLAEIGDELSDNDQGRLPAFSNTVTILNQLVQKKEQHTDNYVPGIYLSGDFGVGKTYLMSALANAVAANDIDVTMIHWTSLLDQLKNTFRSNDNSLEERVNEVKTATVLIIDDIGADSLSSWARDSILSVILEYRMQNELTTCFTSNFDFESLEKYLADTKDGHEPGKAARLMQRVRFLSRPIAMAGENRRFQG